MCIYFCNTYLFIKTYVKRGRSLLILEALPTYPPTSEVLTEVGSACRGILKDVRIKKNAGIRERTRVKYNLSLLLLSYLTLNIQTSLIIVNILYFLYEDRTNNNLPLDPFPSPLPCTTSDAKALAFIICPKYLKILLKISQDVCPRQFLLGLIGLFVFFYCPWNSQQMAPALHLQYINLFTLFL